MTSSKSYLEGLLNTKITSIAYPDGSYTNAVIDIAEKIGFREQLAVTYLNPNDALDNRIQNRIGLNQYETLAMQKLNMLK